MGEPARKLSYPTAHHARADELLGQAAELTGLLKQAQAECQTELDRLAAKHRETIVPIKQKLESLDKAIKAYAKKHQVDLFKRADRAVLRNGSLLHQVREAVTRARNVLDRLEEIGAFEAIKIVKSVDWDKLETWTGEKRDLRLRTFLITEEQAMTTITIPCFFAAAVIVVAAAACVRAFYYVKSRKERPKIRERLGELRG